MLIGYSQDDRIMDPQGAFRLYQMAVNSKREIVEGTGPPSGIERRRSARDASTGIGGLGREAFGGRRIRIGDNRLSIGV